MVVISVGYLNGQDLPFHLGIYPRHDEDPLGLNASVMPCILEAGVEYEVGVGDLKWAVEQLLDIPVQVTRKFANERRGEGPSAGLFFYGRRLPRRDTIHVCLHEGANQRLLLMRW